MLSHIHTGRFRLHWVTIAVPPVCNERRAVRSAVCWPLDDPETNIPIFLSRDAMLARYILCDSPVLVRLSVLLAAEGCYGTDDRHAHHKYCIVGVGAMISCLTPVGLKHVQLNLSTAVRAENPPNRDYSYGFPFFLLLSYACIVKRFTASVQWRGRREGMEKGEGRRRKRREGTGLASSFFNFWLRALSSLSCRPQSESVRYSGHAATYLIVKGQTVTWPCLLVLYSMLFWNVYVQFSVVLRVLLKSCFSPTTL